jgi:hypothetical protein
VSQFGLYPDPSLPEKVRSAGYGQNMSNQEFVIEIRFTEGDVLSMAEEAEVDDQLALERAADWSRSITDTAVQTINELLYNVVKTGQP